MSGAGASPRTCKFGAKRIDRRGVGGKQGGAVEDNRHHRASRRKPLRERIERDNALARKIATDARHGLGCCAIDAEPGVAGQAAEQRPQILAPAFAEELEQRRQFLRRQRRGSGEALIVAILSRQKGKRDVAFARDSGKRLDPVTPPVEPAEQPHDDDLGVARDLVDPEIDRHRMAEVAQMCEAHTGE